MSEETYYQRNKEKQLALAKAYRQANRDKYQAYWRNYYQVNKVELLAKRKEYARKHREKIYEKNRTMYYPRHQQKKKEEAAPVQEPLPQVEEQPRYFMTVTPGTVEVRFD